MSINADKFGKKIYTETKYNCTPKFEFRIRYSYVHRNNLNIHRNLKKPIERLT